MYQRMEIGSSTSLSISINTASHTVPAAEAIQLRVGSVISFVICDLCSFVNECEETTYLLFETVSLSPTQSPRLQS